MSPASTTIARRLNSPTLTFDPECANVIEMVAVQVRVYTEESAEQPSNGLPEVLRKRFT